MELFLQRVTKLNMKMATATITTKLNVLTRLGLLREGESQFDDAAWVGRLISGVVNLTLQILKE
jgi:hypothetical protein